MAEKKDAMTSLIVGPGVEGTKNRVGMREGKGL
jgi:hypothetical protein